MISNWISNVGFLPPRRCDLNQLGGEGWELVSIFSTQMDEGSTRDVFAV